MKKLFLVLIAAVLTACSNDSTAPGEDLFPLLEDASVLAYGMLDKTDPANQYIARLQSLPDSLKLTAAQQQQIGPLVAAYATATKADTDALKVILDEAHAARTSGKAPAEVQAIIAKAETIRSRLQAAEAKLRTDLMALLTPAQQAWVNAARTNPCADAKLNLTESQKTQIAALVAAFETTNSADLDAMRKVNEEARAAHAAGATREQIGAILEKARAPMERVLNAQVALNAAILALLTPEQRASGCFAPMGGQR